MAPKKEIKTFDDLLDKKYGKINSKKRQKFELKSKSFMIGELIKTERKKANMTQEQLALKTKTKKSYISRIENGKSDIQLSTLFKIMEDGLKRKVELHIS